MSAASPTGVGQVRGGAEVPRLSLYPYLLIYYPNQLFSHLRAVLFKLYIHTALMITLPIATYFLSASYYFQGWQYTFLLLNRNLNEFFFFNLWTKGDNNTTKAAIASAAIANLVVISFIISAFMEDTETVRKKKE
ncbi:hypothetical protein G9A89_011743 [Geosiphon pyriformis]|nr:hypothetical protein G9A89_011743 [Geosiphon pyriformis]